MVESQDQKSAAQAIVAIPLFYELMAQLEQSKVNAAVAADYTDREKRQGHIAAVRAIRNLRTRIGALAEGKPSVGKKAPA